MIMFVQQCPTHAPREESLYDHPNGQGASTNEKDEHRGVSQNVPKKKNIKVKKKAKQEKIEMVSSTIGIRVCLLVDLSV